jgi:hypothetical protein
MSDVEYMVDNYLDNYSDNDVIELLDKYSITNETFINKPYKDQIGQLIIEENDYTIQDKYKIIMYFMIHRKEELIKFIKEELRWSFDFYIYNMRVFNNNTNDNSTDDTNINIEYLKVIKSYFDNRIKCKCKKCNKKICKDNKICYMSENNIYHPKCYLGVKDDTNMIKVYITNCTVCLDDTVKEYVVFNCGHMICINCITEYKKYSNKCSYCRTDLDIVGYIEF